MFAYSELSRSYLGFLFFIGVWSEPLVSVVQAIVDNEKVLYRVSVYNNKKLRLIISSWRT